MLPTASVSIAITKIMLPHTLSMVEKQVKNKRKNAAKAAVFTMVAIKAVITKGEP